jgi:hypothetical protein
MKKRLDRHVQALNLIPETQMAYKERTTTTALILIQTIIFTAWAAGKVVSILSLDMSGAYNRLNRQKLLDLMYESGIPRGLVKMTCSFLSFRKTTFRIPGFTSEDYFLDRGVPQGSPLSAILFLLYTALLLKVLCEQNPEDTTHRFAAAFADDTYVIRVGDSILENCEYLAADFKICEQWAECYDMKFGCHKLESINFSRRPKDAEYLGCIPDIPGFEKSLSLVKGMKILGVILDPKLKWGFHMKHVCNIYRVDIPS